MPWRTVTGWRLGSYNVWVIFLEGLVPCILEYPLTVIGNALDPVGNFRRYQPYPYAFPEAGAAYFCDNSLLLKAKSLRVAPTALRGDTETGVVLDALWEKNGKPNS